MLRSQHPPVDLRELHRDVEAGHSLAAIAVRLGLPHRVVRSRLKLVRCLLKRGLQLRPPVSSCEDPTHAIPRG